MGEVGTRLRRTLPAHPASAGEARRSVRTLLQEVGRPDLVDSAQLLLSEVVTNALVHAGSAVDILVTVGTAGLRAEVGDGSVRAPTPRSYAASASTGRGLALVETLADDWGVVTGPHGKTVWFEVGAPDPAPRPTASTPAPHASRVVPAPSEPGGTDEDAVQVELLNVPLLLHAAWQQHAEALLREHLLASPEAAAESFAVHVAAAEALALLAKHVPPGDIGEDPGEVLRSGAEPHASSAVVTMSVPESALPHFDTLDRTLESALRLAASGMFLTPPVQPELQSLRRWLCGQVAAQAGGGTPLPWSANDQPPPPPRRVLAWDVRPITGAAEAQIAIDDTNRIIAVSEPALELLGYTSGSQLVGRRVVAIIPERYRQAHVAGFSLHQLTGRAPLLDTTVVVPARRRDGSEVTVELGVRAHHLAPGRSVFVGTLR